MGISLSVIIPTYNGAGTIEKLLEGLLAQDFADKEIIVVDDGSSDNTSFLSKKYPVRLLKQTNQGAGPARNAGARVAKGEILVFCDSDCVVPKNWLKKHYQAHRQIKNAVIGGGVKNPREKKLIAITDHLTSWYNAHEDLAIGKPEYLPSLNLSLSKKNFAAVGGFWQKRLTGEDVDFCMRAKKKGLKIIFDPSLAIWHQSPSFTGFLAHQFAWGSHARGVRGQNKDLYFHWLFSGSGLKALFIFLPIVLGKTAYQAYCWLPYKPLEFLICLPLILLGNLAYGLGNIRSPSC